MALPVTLTDSSFRTQVIDSEKPVLVFFWAEWNSTCKALAPTIRVLAEEDGEHLTVARLDVDANPVTPAMFGIPSVPVLMLFAGGQALFRLVGYRRIDVLRAEIEAALVGV
ncbi:MAG TPA: thioredoxin domain-containing protein [Candidatus Angelobacter sp.]|jgi:thioredoxin 1|nr:thioredoxin domain-containing protein [Candidatus Angelobacter sp.]